MKRTASIFTLLLILIFGCVTTCTFSQSNRVEKYTIYTYGRPQSAIYQNARSVVGDRWGIEFNSLAGCVVTSSFTDSVSKLNTVAYNMLETKYGKDWNDKFNNEVEEEHVREQEVMKLFEESEIYQTIIDPISKAKSIQHKLLPVYGTDYYDITSVILKDGVNDQEEIRFRVDKKSGNVEIHK